MSLDTHMVFVDYEKASNKVCRFKLWGILIHWDFHFIQNIYAGISICIDFGNERLL